MNIHQEVGRLAKIIRQGLATPSDAAEYRRLDAVCEAESEALQRQIKGIYELPIFEWAWMRDAEIRRGC